MAEESQTTKRHKTSETHTQHDLPQGTPIGEDLDPQIPIPIGEEELKQDGNGNDDSEGEQNSFRDTDTCKILDDHLNLITSNLPEFKHLHALVSANLLGEVDKIEDPQEKNKAFHHLRVSLKNIIPRLNSSKASLQHEISQLQITISSQKDSVDTHKAKVKKQGKLLREASSGEDADLTTQVADLRVEFDKLQAEHATLDQDYQIEVQKLEVLTTNSATLSRETSLWEATLKQVKQAIAKRKRAFRKRQSVGDQAGSSELDLTNVEEWVLLSAGPRTAQQRVRDPLQAMNPYDRLSCMWASQPLNQQHPFNKVVDRSTLTPPMGGEETEVLSNGVATIIFYLLPEETAMALRYINALDFPRPATHLRVIKPKGQRDGEAQIPVVITHLTAYVWRLLHQRVVYFTTTLAVGIRHAVNDETTVEPRHAWVERVPNHPKWLPHNYPFDIQNIILAALDCDAILMPKRLDMSWYEAICLSTSGLDIVFKTTSELAKFMRHTHEDIPLFIAQGGVSNTTARVMGDSFTMDVPLGPYAVDFLNIPRTVTAERLLEVLGELNLHPQGFKDVTRGRGARAPIFRVGFPDKQLRHEAVLTLSGQILPQLFRGPLRVSLARDIPKGHCYACGKKGHNARDQERCFPTCRICHEPMVVVEDGNEYEHDCVYIQEEYDPRAFKKQFQTRSRPSAATTPRSLPKYFTTPQGKLPKSQQPSQPRSPASAPHRQGEPTATLPPQATYTASSAPPLSFEQFQQQQMHLQQQQYQAYLQQQQQLQYPVQLQHQPAQVQPLFYQPPPQYQPQYQPQFSPQGYPPRPQYAQPPPQYHGQQYEQQSSHQMEQGGGADGSQPGFGRGWGKSSPVPSRSQRGLNMEEDEDRRTL